VDYTEKIKAGLLLWLKDVHGIDAYWAELSESEVERGYYDGCETCGYGGDDDTIVTRVTYASQGVRFRQNVEIKGTSIDFLPELLKYIDRVATDVG